MLSDQDTRDAAHHGMQQEMIQLYTAFGAQASFIEPESPAISSTAPSRSSSQPSRG